MGGDLGVGPQQAHIRKASWRLGGFFHWSLQWGGCWRHFLNSAALLFILGHPLFHAEHGGLVLL